MNEVLFKSILAMDSYNRGYGAAIDLRPRDSEEQFIPDPANDNPCDLRKVA